jgi:hypothetical protein
MFSRDIFLNEDMTIVYRTCLGLIKYIEADLMRVQFEEMMGLLQQLLH